VILSNQSFNWLDLIPNQWEIDKVKDHFYFSNIQTENFDNYPVLSLTMSGVKKRNMDTNEGQLPESYEKYNLVDPSCLVFNPMDLISGWVDVPKTEGLISPSYRTIKLRSDKTNLHFIKYYFQSLYKEKVLFYFGEGVHYDYRWGLGKETLKNFPIPIPPTEEQNQIVDFLDKKINQINELIKKIEQKITLLKEQRTSLMNEVVTKGLNPNIEMKNTDIDWIGEIPRHWELLRLNNLGRFSKGKGITKDKIKENGNKCIRCGEIYTTYQLRFNETKSFIDDETTDESILCSKGVLLFTGDGESLEEIGKCVVYEGDEQLYVGGGINVFTPKQEKVIPTYLSYVMNSDSVIYQKSRQGRGEIVVHIYSKQLKEIRLGLPPIKEQQQIVEYLDEQTQKIDEIIFTEEKRTELLKEYKQSLISEVVTGKKRVV